MKIKKLRQYLNLTQEDFSAKIGLTRSNYSHLEIGKSNPTVDTLYSIAKIFRIDAIFFFF